MNTKQIDAAIYDKLQAMAVVSCIGSVEGILLKLIWEYEAAHLEEAKAVVDYMDLLKEFCEDLPIDTRG